ncbi:MAG: DMT family transporter [Proteobacteria bacterium]|nr:DMT family transporter [Pseudomonadota bacterium]
MKTIEYRQVEGQQQFKWLGVLWLSLVIILFACGPIAVKVAVDRMPPIFMGAIRFSLSMPLLLAVLIYLKKDWRLRRAEINGTVISGLLMGVQICFFYVGTQFTTAGKSAFLQFSFPLFITFFGPMFIINESFSLKKMLGSLMGFAGLFLCLKQSIEFGKSQLMGDILVLVGGILLSACYVYEKRLINNLGYDKWRLLFWKFLVGIGFMFVFSSTIETWHISQYDAPFIAAMVYQVVIMTIFCWVSIQYFIANFSAVSVGAFFFLTPVVGLYADVFLGGTRLDLSLVAATLLMVAGIFMVSRAR